MLRTLALATAVFALSAASAAAIPFDGVSRNVELVNHLAEPDTGGISINFIRYEDGRDVMFVSSSIGIYAYDITKDPAGPALLSKCAPAAPRAGRSPSVRDWRAAATRRSCASPAAARAATG